MTLWDSSYAAITEPTSPPPYLDQTLLLHTTSLFVISPEHRKHVNCARQCSKNVREELDCCSKKGQAGESIGSMN